jgi:hypothetical protein
MWRANNGWEVNLLTARIYLPLSVDKPDMQEKIYRWRKNPKVIYFACVRASPLDFTASHLSLFYFFFHWKMQGCAHRVSVPNVLPSPWPSTSIIHSILPGAIVWAHILVTGSSA